MKTKSLNVAQDPKALITPEILAGAIKDIADAVRSWERSGMKRRALVLLIHDLSKVSLSDITYVLNSIESLDSEYCIQRPSVGAKAVKV